MAACDPDQEVAICSSPSDPVFVEFASGGSGLTDTELRATPVKVDDDATQTALTDGSLRGTVVTTVADGADVALGATADASTANTVIGRLKKLVSLLPTALGGHGGLVVEGVASGTAVPVSAADGTVATIGALADAEVSGDGAASVIAILKRIRTLLGFSLNAGTTDATTLRVITASDGPLNTAIGATGDAAVSTDTTGSVSGKLRGLVKILADVWDSTNHKLNVSNVISSDSTFRSIDVQNGTSATIKASAGVVLSGYAYNNAATVRFIKLYNKTGATTADTPLMTIPVPAASGALIPLVAFGTALSVRAVTLIADNNDTAPTANDVTLNLTYR